MTQVIVCCDGVTIPAGFPAGSKTILRSLNHRGPESNVNLRIRTPSSTLLTTVVNRPADLIRIAAYVFAADQSVSRGGEADAHGDDWKRQFILHLPVLDLEFWNRESVIRSLSETLNFVSGDIWNFQFYLASPEQGQLKLDLDPNSILGYPDGVYLFSGGLDSLCAVVEAAVHQGRRPLLVSHSPAFNIRGRQRNLVRILRARFPDWTYPLLSVAIHGTGSEPSDYTQRTRSFLFACLGAVFAHQLDLAPVHLADNGVVSLNLPINSQLIGSRASRSTHPKFLRLFNRLLQFVFPDGPVVSNPLWDRTRVESLKVLRDIDALDLIEETNSCAHGRNLTRMQSHCGVCSQCIDRRIATTAAGLSEYDPPERYRVDIFRQGISSGRDRTMATSYVRFATEVEDLDETGLFSRFPDLYECIDANEPNAEIMAASLTDMLKRHAKDTMHAVAEQFALAKGELARETLPPDSLLRLIAGSSHAGSSQAGSDSIYFSHSPDYREVWLAEERFALTTNQARVVQLLDRQRLEGVGTLSQGYILGELEIMSRNLANVFRSSPAWHRLVIPAEGSGMYRLNIHLP